MQAALERYKMRHTYYGELRGDFVATGGDFLKRGWRLWIGPSSRRPLVSRVWRSLETGSC